MTLRNALLGSVLLSATLLAGLRPTSALAEVRSLRDAQEIAADFFESKEANKNEERINKDEETTTRKAHTSHFTLHPSPFTLHPSLLSDSLYVFTGESSTVFVSGSTLMPEVLGYTDEPLLPSDTLNPAFRYWLQSAKDAVARFEKGVMELLSSFASSPVSPLLGKIKWSQLDPYNAHCPVIEGKATPVGCVATAMAQIIYYYRYAEGKGRESYQQDYTGDTLSIDFEGSTYDFETMSAIGGNSSAGVNELARFNYHVGASIHMQYAPSASAAYASVVPYGLISHFSYSPYAIHIERSWYSDAEWHKILRNEILNGRPVLYDGQTSTAGHAFVLDGLDADGFYHVNWGWGGGTNGHYSLDCLQPGSYGPEIPEGTTGGFEFDQGAVVNFAPSLQEGTADVRIHNAIAASYFGPPSGCADDTTIALNQKATIAMRHVFNYNQMLDDHGTYGVMICDAQGSLVFRQQIGRINFYTNLTDSEIYGVYADRPYSSRPNYELQATFRLPPLLSDGVYRIYLSYTPSYDGSQSSPIHSSSAHLPYVRLEVSQGTGRLRYDCDTPLEPTGLSLVPDDVSPAPQGCFDLSGRPLPAPPSRPGLCVRKGKVIWIR